MRSYIATLNKVNLAKEVCVNLRPNSSAYMYSMEICTKEIGKGTTARLGKLNLMFRISHLTDLHEGGRSLFITSKCYTFGKSTVQQH